MKYTFLSQPFQFSTQTLVAALVAAALGVSGGVTVFQTCVGQKPMLLASSKNLSHPAALSAETFLGDVRTSTAVRTASDECLVLRTADGAEIRYLFDRSAGSLTRIKAGSPSLVLTGLRSFKLSLFDSRQNRVATAATARIVALDWADAGFGRKVIARLRG